MLQDNLFGRRLREARKRAGISQVNLGTKAGFDEFSASARMSQYETGKHLPDLGTASRLAAVLDTPLAYFFCLEEDLAKHLLLLHQLSSAQRIDILEMTAEILQQTC